MKKNEIELAGKLLDNLGTTLGWGLEGWDENGPLPIGANCLFYNEKYIAHCYREDLQKAIEGGNVAELEQKVNEWLESVGVASRFYIEQ